MLKIEIAQNLFFMVEENVAILVAEFDNECKEACLFCQNVGSWSNPNYGHAHLRQEADKHGISIVVGCSCMANSGGIKRLERDRFDDRAKSVLVNYDECELLTTSEQEAYKQLQSHTHQA